MQTAVTTTIEDDNDEVEVKLTGTESTSEDGGSITYTATISQVANNDVTVTLNVGANGEAVSASNPALTITIPAGQLTADSSAIAVNKDADDGTTEDKFNENVSVSAAITAVSEDAVAGSVGSLENLTFDATAVTTTIEDDNDEVEVKLTGTESTSEDGGSITYTATISQVANNDVTVTLNVGANGEAVSASNPALTITIPAGQLTADSSAIAVNKDADDGTTEDKFNENVSVSAAITAVSEDAVAGSVGSLENLTFDATAVTTTIEDDNDEVEVKLTGTESTSEDGGSITYTATISQVANNDVTVTLNVGANGEAVSASNPALTITIPAGQLTADSSAIAVNKDADDGTTEDKFNENVSVSAAITAVSEDAVAGSVGSLENLTFDATAVTTTIEDDNDEVEVKLTGTESTSEDGGSITYTANYFLK